MSPSREHVPPASGLAGWAGRYLALTVWVTGLVGTALGGLVGATWAYSNVDHELAAHQKLLDEHGKQQEIFQKAMVDVDRRFNEQNLALIQAEQRSHDANTALHEQLAVLGAQVALFGSRTIPAQSAQPGASAQPQGGSQP